jgi:hypothetical protein
VVLAQLFGAQQMTRYTTTLEFAIRHLLIAHSRPAVNCM